jgi:transcriptional regulator
MRKNLTLKYLNEKIAAPLGVELVKGEGYFYLLGDIMAHASQSGIYVYKINDLTFDGWKDSIEELVNEAQRTKASWES